MRQVAKKGLITMVATGGVVAVTGGYAYADAGASGVAQGSPGIGSGNVIQVPVHVPINICGNTLNVIGVLNPASGNTCVNKSGGAGHGVRGGSGTRGVAQGSPGIASGNLIQVPIDTPVNVCGNSVNLPGALNPAHGNSCVNSEGGAPVRHLPPEHHRPHFQPPEHHKRKHCGCRPKHVEHQPPAQGHLPPSPVTPVTTTSSSSSQETLASTGAGQLGLALPVSAGMVLSGVVLYRRARAARH